MALHPEVAKALASLPAPPDQLEPAAMRAAEEEQVPPVQERSPMVSVEETTAATDAGEVPLRIYTPIESDVYGLLVYCHGGAFFLGNLNTHDHLARSLAEATGLRVLSVDYRRAPEAAFPAGLQDCYGVVQWAAHHGDRLAWDGRTLAIAGDSSGGNFAAVVATMARDDDVDVISHQVLLYPSLDLDFDGSLATDRYPSLRENAVGYGLETAGLKPFNAFYLDSGADPADPMVSPLRQSNLSGLPPALIITAEHDPLRDEGERYGELIREAGGDARVIRYAGAGHGFLQHFAWIPEFQQAFDDVAEFVR